MFWGTAEERDGCQREVVLVMSLLVAVNVGRGSHPECPALPCSPSSVLPTCPVKAPLSQLLKVVGFRWAERQDNVMAGVRNRGEGLEWGVRLTPLSPAHCPMIAKRRHTHLCSLSSFQMFPCPVRGLNLAPPGPPASGTRVWPPWEKRAGLHCRSGYWGPSSL